MTSKSEGERFIATFGELKAAVGDDPDTLSRSLEGNQRLQKLCDELDRMVAGFRVHEEWSPYAFTHHVNVAGAHARRDYEERWSKVVGTVAGRELLRILKDLIKLPDAQFEHEEPRDRLGDQIASWKDDADTDARRVEQFLDFAHSHQEVDDSGDLDWVHGSLLAWDRLKVAGLDVEGALWRRRAIPHVLVPSHVARHYESSGVSLYRRLHQAGLAFVFGAPLAALALQRAVLEEVLRTHWRSERGTIREANLPELSWDARAHRLRSLANDALHNDTEKLLGDDLDRAIIQNFLLLRTLIEQAPEKVADGRGTKR